MLRPVNISHGEQFATEFLAIAPNNRIPAIIDRDPPGGGAPIPLFESGAILLYLGGKTGRFLPNDLRARCDCVQWLFWQMAGLGPMLGQNHHFANYAPEKIPYAIERYRKETARLYAVLDKRLADRAYVAGDYTIADMACYPWILPERQGQDIDDFPNIKRWKAAIGARPAVLRAYEIAKGVNQQPAVMDERSRHVLFGQDAATVRGR